MEEKVRVYLKDNYNDHEAHLLLTPEQVRLIQYLYNEDWFMSSEEFDYEIFDDNNHLVEI